MDPAATEGDLFSPAPPAGERFPRTLRVGGRTQFDRIFSEGRRASAPGLLVVSRSNGLDHSRLGISIGKRFGPAVQRNRAKRLLREAFRRRREKLPAGYDFIAVPRSVGFPDRPDAVGELLATLAERSTRDRKPRGPGP